MTVSQGRKASVAGTRLPFQERRFVTGRTWKHPGIIYLQLGEM